MPRSARPSSRRVRGSALVAAALSLALFAPTSAVADEASDAPVTVDDTVELDGYGDTVVDVLANDTDPNGDELTICRVKSSEDDPIYVDFFDGLLFVGTFENKTASYEVTYYACDFDYLTPATLTINVTKVPEVKAKKAKKPGRVKFTNPGSKRVVVLYGSVKEEEPDGQVGLKSEESKTVGVIRKRLYYVAFVRRTGSLAGQGFVKDIKIPKKSDARAVAPSFDAKALKAWTTARS